jgi:Rps23 Pro-64 3,4-dihydroxylase Tpa1-like proline 4-hydroxylase
LNSKAFATNVIDLFSDKIGDYNPVHDFKTFSFDSGFLKKGAFSSFLRNLDKRQLHEISSKQLLKVVLFRVLKRFTSYLRIDSFSSKEELYLHLDISEASTGYGREIHHDNDNRLAAMVFYLNDQNNAQGGEFGIHEYIEDTPLERCVPHPDESEMKLSNLITPQKNTLVLFLSTPNSYHSVPVIKSIETTRKFVYAGISCKRPSVWSDVILHRQ